MARGKLTIYDVPPESRSKGAAEARKNLLQMLSNPHLSSVQRKDLTDRLKWVSKWETLNVSEVLPKPVVIPDPAPVVSESPGREPVNHDVSIAESMSVSVNGQSESTED